MKIPFFLLRMYIIHPPLPLNPLKEKNPTGDRPFALPSVVNEIQMTGKIILTYPYLHSH